MANTVTISTQLKIVDANGNAIYQSLPTSFTGTQTATNGPSPGMVTATTSGVTVSLAQLSTAAYGRIRNTDPTNFVTVGLYDGTTFRPFCELLPGESYPLRLSRTLLTANAGADVLRVKADTNSCNVLFEIFDA